MNGYGKDMIMNDKTISIYEIRQTATNVDLVFLVKHSISSNDFNLSNAANIMNQIYDLGEMAVEHFYTMAKNKSGNLGIMLNGVGNERHTEIDIQPLILFLVLFDAKQFMIFHNHPNYILEASSDDIECMKIIQQKANELSMDFLGSIVIAGNKYIKIGDDTVYDIKKGEQP